jgi:RHS repeat-associated protein
MHIDSTMDVELNNSRTSNYGSARFDQQASFNGQRRYIGQEYDAASQRSHLNARNYDEGKGEFLDQDSSRRAWASCCHFKRIIMAARH